MLVRKPCPCAGLFHFHVVRMALTAAVLTALVPARPASAHMLPLTDRQLAAVSTDIVVAVVESSHSRWNDGGTLIVTDYALRIEDRIKGGAPERLTLTIPGGTVDGETHVTCVSTPLAEGARYVLFLDRPEEGSAGGCRPRQTAGKRRPVQLHALREWRSTYSRSTLSIRDCQPSPVDLKNATTSGL